jgi:quercetin dioxygenase-like cupin family protein
VFRRIVPTLATVLVLTAGCGGAATPAPTSAPAVATTTPPSATATILASGKLDSIPAGALFVNYVDLPQAAGGSIKHQHIAGFVYSVQGTHQMDVDGGASVMIQPGKAAFIGATVMHGHVNPGTSANDWWFIGLRPAASRPLAIIVPGQKELYTTGDLTQIAAGSYTETLSDTRLAATGVDRQSGPSLRVLFVLDGSLTVSGDAGMTGNVSAGQGAYALPGANLVLTAGPAGGHYLMFALTPAS